MVVFAFSFGLGPIDAARDRHQQRQNLDANHSPTERPISGYINAITRNAETLHNNGRQVSRITLRKNGKGQIALQRRRLHGLTSLRQHVASPTKLSRTDPRDGDVAQENPNTSTMIHKKSGALESTEGTNSTCTRGVDSASPPPRVQQRRFGQTASFQAPL